MNKPLKQYDMILERKLRDNIRIQLQDQVGVELYISLWDELLSKLWCNYYAYTFIDSSKKTVFWGL